MLMEEVIHEKLGDGDMSAIDFTLDIRRKTLRAIASKSS
jgi:cyanate lyase